MSSKQENQPIRGKVARILNSRELVINLGSNDGVIVGMKFDVLDPKGEDIKDPDTGEVLGSLSRPKVRVRVKTLDDRICVAATFRERQVNIGGVGTSPVDPLGTVGVLSELLRPPKYVKKVETFKTDEKTWEDIEETQSFVKTGDPVIQVIEEQAAPSPPF
jgi:hypothetical protein